MKNKTLSDYLKQLPARRQKKIEARAREIRAEELSLRELRKALRCSQETVADVLGVKQAEVSKMERRTDMYLSTLRRYVEAMGGRLDLMASFPKLKPILIKELSSIELIADHEHALQKKGLTHRKTIVSARKRAHA
jgi:transcriptional regulator with XRE-family HTH domain